jgi:hypothetical protein
MNWDPNSSCSKESQVCSCCDKNVAFETTMPSMVKDESPWIMARLINCKQCEQDDDTSVAKKRLKFANCADSLRKRAYAR